MSTWDFRSGAIEGNDDFVSYPYEHTFTSPFSSGSEEFLKIKIDYFTKMPSGRIYTTISGTNDLSEEPEWTSLLLSVWIDDSYRTFQFNGEEPTGELLSFFQAHADERQDPTPISLDPNQIVLYPPTETEFTYFGDGVLSDAISCFVTEEKNGAFEFEMQYPIFGKAFSKIRQRSIIKAKSCPNDDGQYFRVYRITKPLNGIVTIYAAHISYDLAGTIVEPFTAGSAAAALAYLQSASVGDNGFTFLTDKSTVATMQVKVPSSVRSLLGGSKGSVLDVYGGEWEFDKFTCYLHNRIGADRGFTIRYGKNLTDLTQEENCSAVYTAVYPYWASSETEAVVTLPEKIIEVADVRQGAHYDFNKVLVRDFSQDFEEQPTEEQLRTATEDYIRGNDVGIPKVSLDVSFVQLEQSDEYANISVLEQVYLGDTVTVEFEQLGVSAKARVVKTVYNCLLDRYEKIEIGNAKSSIADTIANQQEEIKKLDPANFMSDVEAAAIRASQLITGNRGGYVVIHSSTGSTTPDEILIMDTPDIQTAQKVWRWNNSGLGYSDTGYSGTYKTAWTIDGAFNADFITAGFLSANRIKAGVITSESSDINTWNNFNGTVNVDEAVYKTRVPDTGVKVFKYIGSSWNIRNGSTYSPITLSTYGITVGGTFTSGDYFTVIVWDSKIINTLIDLNSGELSFDFGQINHKGQVKDCKLKIDEHGLELLAGNDAIATISGFEVSEDGVVSTLSKAKFDLFETLRNRVVNPDGDIVAEIGRRSDGGGQIAITKGGTQPAVSMYASENGGVIQVLDSSGNIINQINRSGIIVSGGYIALGQSTPLAIREWSALNNILNFSKFHGTLVYGRPTSQGNYSSCVVPSQLYNDGKKWQLADELNWISFTVDEDGVPSYVSHGGSNPSSNIGGYAIF